MSDFSLILYFFADMVRGFFTLLGSIQILDTGFSVYQVFVGFLFTREILDFINWFRNPEA